jgi:hypothetical protein
MGTSFDPIAAPPNFPANGLISKCLYGNANAHGSYNAYCTVTQPSGFGAASGPYGLMFSNDGGRTWSFKTTATSTGSAVPIDYIGVHPVFPDVLLVHRTIDASNNL